MTAPVRVFVPSPERSWEIADEGGIRISEATKVQALIWAAQCAQTDFKFIGGEHWITIRRRLMHSSTPTDSFMDLVRAVAEGDRARIQTVAEALVSP